MLNIDLKKGEVGLQDDIRSPSNFSPRKLKVKIKPKQEKEIDVYEEGPKVEVDHKKDNERLEISMRNLRLRKAFLMKGNPIFNRELDNGPEVYGQHFNAENLFKMGQLDMVTLNK
jgi:hypothetical protein